MTTAERPIITLLTDFGTDGAAAICRGVMLGICRDAQIVDVSHTVRKYAVRDASFILTSALPFMPLGVHVAVVDPGVGTQRRPIALRAGRGDVLVGPDNGVLIEAAAALGGISEARLLENRAYWLPVISSTFHGRDIFAPVAAHLAADSADYASLGSSLDIVELLRLPEPDVRAAPGRLETEVIYIDSFGNLRLAGSGAVLHDAFGEMEPGTQLVIQLAGGDDGAAETARIGTTFGAVPAGAVLLYLDSSGHPAIAQNRGNLNARLGLTAGTRLVITGARS